MSWCKGDLKPKTFAECEEALPLCYNGTCSVFLANQTHKLVYCQYFLIFLDKFCGHYIDKGWVKPQKN